MSDICKCITTARLTRDPEIKTTASGKTILSFGVASNPGYSKDDEPTFLECQMWGERGTKLADIIKKGSRVAIEGTLRQSSWTDTSGKKQSRFRVDVTEVVLLESKVSSDGGHASQPVAPDIDAAIMGGGKSGASATQLAAPFKPRPAPAGDNFQDDIPF